MAFEDTGAPIHSTYADDQDMVELIEMFTSELPARIKDLEAAAREQAWERLKTLAHQLKGAAPGYGFESIGVAAGGVEKSLLSGSEPAELADDLKKLLSLCRRASRPGSKTSD